MTAKTTKSNKGHKPDDSLEQNQSLAKPTSRTSEKKDSKASLKKVLSHEEKLEAARRANLAMMKAWELISQRNDSGTDDQSNV